MKEATGKKVTHVAYIPGFSTPSTEIKNGGVDMKPKQTSDSSDFERLLKSQAYIIQHQQDLLDAAIKRNAALVTAYNELERENEALRKKVKAHEEGRLWTMFCSLLPTREMFDSTYSGNGGIRKGDAK